MVFRSWGAGWARALLAVVFSFAVLPTAAVADTIAATVTTTATATAKNRKSAPHFIFGFLPVLSTGKLIKRFEPLADYLSEKMGVDVRFETAPDFAAFQSRTVTGRRYDFLYTAPHLYYLAQRDAVYRVVARVDAKGLYAVIVVREKSPINSLKDLCGKKLTVPDRLALMTVLVRRTVAAIGCKKGNEVVILPTPTHDAALLNAYNGTSDAAGLESGIFKRTGARIVNSMRVIGRTASTPQMPISVAPWVDRKTTGKFTKILLSLNKTKEGRAVLKKAGWPGFKAAAPREYDVMEPYAKFIKY